MPNVHEAPRIYPTFRCTDPDRMIAWLTNTVGFETHVAYRDDGGVTHAELAYGSAMIMLGRHRDDAHEALTGGAEARRTDALYIAVDDPDALHAALVAAGSEIVTPPYETDYGSREFAARDPEGGLWSFGTYWPKAGAS